MSPDDIPEGLLTIPLDELTEHDFQAMRELKRLAERQDWEAVGRLLVEHSKHRTSNKRSNSRE
jgi:hypothetical protein